jgi:hypothetical protein
MHQIANRDFSIKNNETLSHRVSYQTHKSFASLRPCVISVIHKYKPSLELL